MKLGIINGWSEGCIEYVRSKGLDAVEFCVNYNYDSAEFLSKAEEIKGYAAKYNVAVGAIGRWGMQRIDDNGEIIAGNRPQNGVLELAPMGFSIIKL